MQRLICASLAKLLGCVKRIQESGVTMLGLAALDEAATPWYDRNMAQRLTDLGVKIAALTPAKLARWLAQTVS